jgi:hypothetical protein
LSAPLDVSVNYGHSELAFHERDSINVSYWYEPKPGGGIYAESPLEADTGTLKFDQATFNADLRGPIQFGGAKILLAGGVEYRRDNYAIEAGDPVSYQYDVMEAILQFELQFRIVVTSACRAVSNMGRRLRLSAISPAGPASIPSGR